MGEQQNVGSHTYDLYASNNLNWFYALLAIDLRN